MIDGGKGQLSAAVSALDDLGLENQEVAAIAKKEEILFIKGREDQPIELPKDSPVLHLIQMMRDEAHRFAVTYHRKRRELRDFDSELMDIPGIGEVRKKVLLRAFGSLERVKQAAFDELAPYVGPKAASQIIEYFAQQVNADRSWGKGSDSWQRTADFLCFFILNSPQYAPADLIDMLTLLLLFALKVAVIPVKWPVSDRFRKALLPLDTYVAGVKMEGIATLAVEGQILYLNGPKVLLETRCHSACRASRKEGFGIPLIGQRSSDFITGTSERFGSMQWSKTRRRRWF